jgi:hypothetical protein
MDGLGQFPKNAAGPYGPSQLAQTSIRVPNILPEAAWPLAKSGFDRLAAQECQTASAAQHIDEYTVQASYKNLHWTQLLLPVYSTAYRDETGQVYPVFIHGRTGKISGVRRSSQQQANLWSLGISIAAILCFLFGVLLAAGAVLLPVISVISLILFGLSLFIGILAPIPAVWAWNFNRSQ